MKNEKTVIVAVSLTDDYCKDLRLIRYFITPYFNAPNTKEYFCPHCKNPVGHTDGVKLYLAGMSFAWPQLYQCVHCGKLGKWRPVFKPVTKSICEST